MASIYSTSQTNSPFLLAIPNRVITYVNALLGIFFFELVGKYVSENIFVSITRLAYCQMKKYKILLICVRRNSGRR